MVIDAKVIAAFRVLPESQLDEEAFDDFRYGLSITISTRLKRSWGGGWIASTYWGYSMRTRQEVSIAFTRCCNPIRFHRGCAFSYGLQSAPPTAGF